MRRSIASNRTGVSELGGFMLCFVERTFPCRGETHNLIACGLPRKPKMCAFVKYRGTIHKFLCVPCRRGWPNPLVDAG
jgi:hypothetical protein